ncbi:hypothetical protein OY671_010595, partial [Metschnikowia pulcherrima]
GVGRHRRHQGQCDSAQSASDPQYRRRDRRCRDHPGQGPLHAREFAHGAPAGVAVAAIAATAGAARRQSDQPAARRFPVRYRARADQAGGRFAQDRGLQDQRPGRRHRAGGRLPAVDADRAPQPGPGGGHRHRNPGRLPEHRVPGRLHGPPRPAHPGLRAPVRPAHRLAARPVGT